MVAIAPDLPAPPERAVDRQGDPDGQTLNAAAERAAPVAFDEQMDVVLLDREVNHAKRLPAGAGDGAANRREHTRGAQRRQARRGPQRHLHWMPLLVWWPRVVGH